MADKLKPNDKLAVTGSLDSPDGRFHLVLQADGNLVLYGPAWEVRWSSGTYGKTVPNAVMQADGNFVLYDASGAPVWNTATYGNPGAWLQVQNDGNFVIYNPVGKLLWASNTATYSNQFKSQIPVLLLPLRLETKFMQSGTAQNPVYELWLRIFPDDIAVNKHRPALSQEEVDAGAQFWAESRKKTNDRATGLGAWRVLAGAYGAPRAAWIAENTQPEIISTRSKTLGYEPARTEVMPDYYEIRLYGANPPGAEKPDFLAITDFIKTTGSTIHIDVDPKTDNPMDALPKWVTNFEVAISLGLGKKIALTQPQFTQGFTRLEVIGVRSNTSAAEGKIMVENLLRNHRYAHGGLSVLPLGAPTNNTSEGSSAFDSRPDVEPLYDVQFGAAQFNASDPAQRTDGQRMAELLGLAPAVFQRVPNAGQKSRSNAETMNIALWQATMGHYLEEMFATGNMEERLDQPSLDALRDFFTRHVKARGALPAIRVGRQPYGILPVMALKFFDRHPTPPTPTFPLYSANGKKLDDEFRPFFSWLLGKWEDLVVKVPTVDTLSSTPESAAKQFMQIVGLQPHSVQFHQRMGLGFGGDIDPFTNSGQEAFQGWLNGSNGVWKTLYNDRDASQWATENSPDGFDSKFWYQLANPRIRQFRFLQKHALLDGMLAASQEAKKDAPLPLEVPIYNLPNKPPAAYKNYIIWLRDANLNALHTATATGTENFAGSKSLLYLLLRTAVFNQHWDAAMRIYKTVKLKDFQMDNAPMAMLKQRYADVFHGDDMPVEPIASDFNFTFSDPDIQNADYRKYNYSDFSGLSMKQRIAFLYLNPAKVDFVQKPLMSQYVIADVRTGDDIERSKYREFIIRSNNAPSNSNQPMGGPTTVSEPYIKAQNRLPFLFFNLDKIADLRGRADANVKQVNMAAFLKTPRCQSVHFPVETAQLKEFNAHMGILAQLPVAELEHLTAEHLDLCSHRLDAWLLAFANWRLQEQRKVQPQGLYMGAYGYVENLKRDPTGRSSNGYVHAPTLDQAVAAAIMRAGDLDAGNNSVLRVNLSSARVRKALAALEGIRNGLTADDVLPDKEPDKTDAKDAVGDLLLAESVFQLVRGNYDRAAAALDAIGRAGHPPDPEFVKTPRSGTTLTHRAGIAWAHNTARPQGWPGGPLTPRAQADPSFNYWLGTLLGPAHKIVFRYVPNDGTPATDVPLTSLHLHPADLLALAADFQNPAGELAARIRRTAEAITEEALPPGIIRYDYAVLPTQLTPEAAFFLVQKITVLLSHSRPLTPADWTHPSADAAQTGAIDLVEYRTRLSHLQAAFKQWRDGLTEALTLLENGLQSHEFGVMTRPPGGQATLFLQPFPADRYQAVYELLQQSALYGSLTALPTRPKVAVLADGKTLLEIGNNALKLLLKKLVAFQTAKQVVDDSNTALAQVVEHGKKAAEALFEGPVSIAPIFSMTAESLKNSVTEGLLPVAKGTLRAAAQRPLVMEDWLNGIACVRENMTNLESVLLYADALVPDGPAKPRLSPAQLPYRANDHWVGIELPSDYWDKHTGGTGDTSTRSGEEPDRKDKLSLVFAFPNGFDALVKCGGILTDEWNELIPSMTQTTGIAFHYNQPNTMPPQSLILATHWNDSASTNWSMGDLFDCLSSAFRLAKIRAVEPDMLIETDAFGHLLPAVLFKMTDPELEDDISTDLAVNIGSPVYKPRDTSGVNPISGGPGGDPTGVGGGK